MTGAARGIGQAIVSGFAAAGARVHASDILVEALSDIGSAADAALGGSVAIHELDVTDPAAVEALAAEVANQSPSGCVDIAVHAAGGVLGQSKSPIESISDENWRAILAVNLDGAFNLARAVAPGMKKAGRGRIVVVSSRAGLGVSLTGIQSYGTAKTAQIGLVRQLAAELGPSGITVNAVAPGFMPTSPDYVRQWESYGAEGQRALIESIALRRVGRPEDIANGVLFLASDQAEWITGQVLPITGGP